jgi:hypothetical protein
VAYTECQAQQVERTFTENYCERVAEQKEISYTEMVAETEQREVKVAKCIMVAKEITVPVYPNGCATNGCK